MIAKDMLYKTVRGIAARFGLNVTFDRPVRNPMKLLALKAAELDVRTVLDIGANTGQFAQDLRNAGYSGRIVSFEPLTRAHAILQRNARGHAGWLAAPRMALGETPGNAQINISHNLASSSLLAVNQRSIDAAPESDFSGVDNVEVWRLDDAMEPSWEKPLMLKLDTQGFEMHVLKGASRTLRDTTLLITELSLTPLYGNGATMMEVFNHLEQQGFRCISIIQGFADHQRNELLQVDGIFVRDHPAKAGI